jgi:hypothetical protein
VLAIMNAFGVLRDPMKRAEYDSRQNRNRKDDPGSGQERPVRYGSRVAPVRRIPKPSPLLRVTPVRWEEGPWAGPAV